MPTLYPDLNLAVVASHSENVGGAVESLLSGVPVVATGVGGLPDLVLQNETGWLVSPRSPKALAQAMLEALGNPERLGDVTSRGRNWPGPYLMSRGPDEKRLSCIRNA